FSKRVERGGFAAVWTHEARGAPVRLARCEVALFFEGCVLVGRAPASATPLPLFARARGQHASEEADSEPFVGTAR
ncbi:hypothetical protein, partial [Corallococcus sp. RDP092CA]|uniref:hypothetical protein n=1 Tax=Corallococcus sp. RDP092CA TaxID=3109369 RepID=UPI0035B28495